MKSVVVEASTVAKAIELAWQKADKPEEFFIRILQEHSSGFLGFGAQKAKIVFFFKNSQKSDALFPVVLKQKEYANFFGNDKLKAPSQQNVIDHELNKNVVQSNHKKHAQGQGKQKNNHPQPRQATPDAKIQPKPVAQPQQQKPKQPVHAHKTQVKLDLPVKPVPVKQLVAKPELQVKKEVVVQKEHVQKIKTVQTPHIQKTPQVIQPQVVAPKVSVLQQIEEIVNAQPMSSAPVVAPVQTAPRVVSKLKRRPLTGADQGVSGITRSVPKPSVVADVVADKKSEQE